MANCWWLTRKIAWIAQTKVKTDAHDVMKLARLSAVGLIPLVWVPPLAVRKLRALLARLAEGNRVSSVMRTTGHKEDMLLGWLREAATYVSQIEAVLMADYRITRGQLDGLWAYVGNKGEKRTTQKPKRLASSGAPPCWTSTPGSASRAASRKPKPQPRKKSSKR